MQVIILCGGQGTRIRDVADDIPKPMIPIGGRPILWHIMRNFAFYGLTDFILCVGYKSWTIKRYFLDYLLASSDFTLELKVPDSVKVHGPDIQEDWRITLVETGLGAMTGCRVKRVEKYVQGDTFLLTYGDGLCNLNIRHLLEFHRCHGKIGTVTTVRAPSRFGEIELDGIRVQEFNEKPLIARGRISGGYFVFQRQLFERLNDDPELIFECAPLMQLARDGELMAYLHDDFWYAMDSSRDYKLLNDLWDSGEAPWNIWGRSAQRLAA